MPAKDIYRDTVRNALIKDGWRITAENFHLPRGGTRAFVVIIIIADKIFTAETEGRKIAVEVKSFIGKSNLRELEKADFRTAFNYSIDPENNRMKKAKFSPPEVVGLLNKYDIEIDGRD